MIKRFIAASSALFFGVLLLPIIPFMLALIVWNEYDAWEES